MAESFRVEAGGVDDTKPKTLDKAGEIGVVEAGAKLAIPLGTASPAITIRHQATLDIAGEVSTKTANQDAVAVTNANAGAGASLILRGANGLLKTAGDQAYGINSVRDDFSLTIAGGKIETAGFQSSGVYLDGVNSTFTMTSGSILTTGNEASGVYLDGVNSTFTMTSGSILTTGNEASGVFLSGANSTFTMIGGSIETTGRVADGVISNGEKLKFTMSSGRIGTSGDNSVGLLLGLKGNLDKRNPNNYEHLIEIGASAVIATKGKEAHGIRIEEVRGTTSRARLAIAGSITVEGKDAVGVLIEDTVGGVSEFEISGKITATGNAQKAIENPGNLALTIAVKHGARITGNITMGGGNDTLTLHNEAQITGTIYMGEGNDTLTLNDNARITGTIYMGKGDDTLTLAAGSIIQGVFGDIKGNNRQVVTIIDMGPGSDVVKLNGQGNLVIGTINGGTADGVADVRKDTDNDLLDITALYLLEDEDGGYDKREAQFDITWIGFEGFIGLLESDGSETDFLHR